MLNYAILGFPFIRGFPFHEWNETHPLTMIAGQVYECEKINFLKSTTSGFPFIKGSPSMNERKLFLNRWQLANYTSLKRLTFRKVSAKICNFRVPVSKEVLLTWMKWHPSFDDDSWSSVCLWKDSLSEMWVLIYATLVFPFIRGFPSHEWYDTHPLTMTTSKVYACGKVSLSQE